MEETNGFKTNHTLMYLYKMTRKWSQREETFKANNTVHAVWHGGGRSIMRG